MSATRTIKRKEKEKKQVFPGQIAFRVFIKEIRLISEGTGVSDEDIEEIVKLLIEKYGQNLPEEDQW